MNETALNHFAAKYITDLKAALDAIELEPLQQAVRMIQACAGTVWLIGNGGSASLASHMATDLQLAGVRALALTDVAAITTIGNDERYVDTFSTQLRRLAGEGDLVIALSGSGNSYNIGHALGVARDMKLLSLFVSGFDGGWIGRMYTAKEACRFNGLHLNVPVKHMGIAQDGHQVVLHMIAYYLMEAKSEKDKSS